MRRPILIGTLLVLFGALEAPGVAQNPGVEPQATVKLPQDPTRFHLFVLAGQSNMAGRGEVEPEDARPHPRVLSLDRHGEWQAAIDPLHFDKPRVVGVGLGKTFAIRYAEANPGITVGLIPCAVGGSPIASWEPGTRHEQTGSKPYDDTLTRVRTAMKSGVLKGVLWHQGESDSQPELSTAYQQKLDRLIARMRSDFRTPDLPFVVGQLGQFAERPWDQHRQRVGEALRSLPHRMNRTGFADSEGLRPRGDHVHFDSPSLREFGHRYFAAYQTVIRSPATTDNPATTDSPATTDNPATARQASHGRPMKPTYADVSYGTHARNVLDFWQADGDGPRPLLVHIHGGGWTTGDKARTDADVQPYLDRGISYASIHYRLTPEHPLPAPVHDAARAIQFLRSRADVWNIRKDRILLTGGSAGACTAMWLLCHDDLSDPHAEDPVARESTRVTAAAVSAGQTSIDPKVIEPWLGPMVLTHRMIHLAVGEPTIEDALKNYETHRPLYVEFSPYNHVSADDPPLMMTYRGEMTLPSTSAGHGIHHPVYGVKMKEKADQVGQECHLIINGQSSSEIYATAEDFIFDQLLR